MFDFLSDDPSDASPEDVANACGIELQRAPVDLVPLQQYREQGEVRCLDCGKVADPPDRVVATWDGRDTTLCHECWAETLERRTDVLEDEAKVAVLHQAGWAIERIDAQLWVGHHQDAGELLKRARDFI